MINQYKQKYRFDYDLSSQEDTTNKMYSIIINETKSVYNSRQYNQKFKERIKELLEFSKSIKPKPFYLFPVEFQPYFVSSLIVAWKTRYFSSLAVGSKIHLINIYTKIVGAIGFVGLIVSIPFLALLSFWFTFSLTKYNEKHVEKPENANNYFFMFVSIFGFLIAIISMI